jgi:hypothetical protein
MSFGKLALEYCGEQLPLQVLKSGAGFYIGTCDEIGAPVSRESQEYYKTSQLAADALQNGTWTQKAHP